MSSSPYRRTQFDYQIAGPRSGRAYNGLHPALVALNSVSNVIGPGRLSTVKEVLMTITWPAGGSVGEITIEGSDDPDYTGVWVPLAVIPWTAVSKKDQFRYTGGQQALRARASIAVDGGTGVTVTAKGIS